MMAIVFLQSGCQVEGLFPLVCLTTINIHTNQIFVKSPCEMGLF
nr:MAG TPA: hypothetical protein [Caudoviricetes sp.]